MPPYWQIQSNTGPAPNDRFLLAIGEMDARRRTVESIQARGGQFLPFVHPLARVASTAVLGTGAVVYPFAVVSNQTQLGDFVHLNYYASVGHDCRLGRYCLLAPYATLNGFVTLDDEVYISTHGTVAPGTDHALPLEAQRQLRLHARRGSEHVGLRRPGPTSPSPRLNVRAGAWLGPANFPGDAMLLLECFSSSLRRVTERTDAGRTDPDGRRCSSHRPPNARPAPSPLPEAGEEHKSFEAMILNPHELPARGRIRPLPAGGSRPSPETWKSPRLSHVIPQKTCFPWRRRWQDCEPY